MTKIAYSKAVICARPHARGTHQYLDISLCLTLIRNSRGIQKRITEQIKKSILTSSRFRAAPGGDGAPEPVHLRADALDVRHLPWHPPGQRHREVVGGRCGRRGEPLDAGHAVACREQLRPSALLHLRIVAPSPPSRTNGVRGGW